MPVGSLRGAGFPDDIVWLEPHERRVTTWLLADGVLALEHPSPESGVASDMRLMIDAFHAYTSMFRDVCQSNLPVHELVDALVTMVTTD